MADVMTSTGAAQNVPVLPAHNVRYVPLPPSRPHTIYRLLPVEPTDQDGS